MLIIQLNFENVKRNVLFVEAIKIVVFLFSFKWDDNCDGNPIVPQTIFKAKCKSFSMNSNIIIYINRSEK